MPRELETMLMPSSGRRSGPFLDWGLPHLVGSYLLALFAVVAGVVFFPFSDILMGLLFFLVGSFFLVSLIILSATYYLFAVAVFGIIRRTLQGLLRWCATGVASKMVGQDGKQVSAGRSSDLWDRWLDGS